MLNKFWLCLRAEQQGMMSNFIQLPSRQQKQGEATALRRKTCAPPLMMRERLNPEEQVLPFPLLSPAAIWNLLSTSENQSYA